jgi:hypothetical protein
MEPAGLRFDIELGMRITGSCLAARTETSVLHVRAGADNAVMEDN